MNSMIGLETGAISLTDTIKWNGEDVWNDEWKKDHVMKTAFAVSCVPCYQQIARRIGVKRMIKYTAEANYGDLIIDSTTIDSFWLVGNSKISPMEQVQFIERLYHEDLPFSKNTMNNVKEIMLLEETDKYTVRAKTGWSQTETINNGWYVGYLTTSDQQAYVFATNVERTRSVSSDGFAKARKSITMAIFRKLGII
jgi:beta-lactamase class D